LAYDVNFVELSKTVEYKDYKVLERVYLGDFVTVRHSRFNIDVKLQVVSYRKDVLRDMMVEIRLGDKKKDLSNFLNNFSGVVDVLNGAFTEDGKVDASFLKGLINIATNLVLSGNDGHVLIDENGINIMDTTDKMTAEKVWRWNLGGLGYSSMGYDGPFTTAITSTGLIVADFIGAGEIQGGLIKASTILGSAIKAGEITGQHIKADELVVGTNVKMGTGAVITWDSAGVNGVTPPTASNVGARPYDWLPQYGEIQGTKPPF
jgi:phage-related protein